MGYRNALIPHKQRQQLELGRCAVDDFSLPVDHVAMDIKLQVASRPPATMSVHWHLRYEVCGTPLLVAQPSSGPSGSSPNGILTVLRPTPMLVT